MKLLLILFLSLPLFSMEFVIDSDMSEEHKDYKILKHASGDVVVVPYELHAVIKAIDNNFTSMQGKEYTKIENIKVIDEFINDKSNFIDMYESLKQDGKLHYEGYLKAKKRKKRFHCNILPDNCRVSNGGYNEVIDDRYLTIDYLVSNIQEANKKAVQLQSAIKGIIDIDGRDDWHEREDAHEISMTFQRDRQENQRSVIIQIINHMSPTCFHPSKKGLVQLFIVMP